MIKSILLTGANGFLGKEIYQYLKSVNYQLVTLGRNKSNDIICDLGENSPTLNDNFEYVIHAAGKAHMIPKTAKEKEDFHNVNVIGTINLLLSLEGKLPKTFIFISSVAVYGLETGIQIAENSRLMGKTPYAKSKIEAEKKVLEFGEKYNVNIVILRPPLITGKKPSGNLGDLMAAIKKGYYFRIGNGDARRSMVSTIDIAKIIPSILDKNGIFNLTDRKHPSFKDIDTYLSTLYGKKIKILPYNLVKALSYIGDVLPFFPLNSLRISKMTKPLTFSDDKAVSELGWSPESALLELKE